MPGISTTFNSDELSFISSTDWFLQKNSVSVKTSELLHHTALKLKHHLGPTLNPHSFKVSKGENYKGFPYFVLDIPKITSVEEMATLRIILWWGHDIGFHLLLGEQMLMKHRAGILKNLNVLLGQDVFYNATDDVWNHNMNDAGGYKPLEQLTEEELKGMKNLKLSKRLTLDALNALEYHAVNTAELLQKVLAD